MTVGQFLQSPDPADLVVLALLACAFGVGYAHGSIRRVLGVLAIVFSFLVAALIQDPLGEFLANYWHNMPSAYSSMVAFLVVFLAVEFALAVVIHGQYHRVRLWADHPPVDEVLGGLVGVIEGLAGLTFLMIILDRGFTFDTVHAQSAVDQLHSLWSALTYSVTGAFLHGVSIPTFIRLTSFLLPDTIRYLYGR